MLTRFIFSVVFSLVFYQASHGQFLVVSSVGREFCTICHNARSWNECHEKQCGPHQDCYIDVTEDNRGKLINARCIDDGNTLCSHNHKNNSSNHGGFLIGKRAKLCETCCASDNCNIDHCKHIVFTKPTHHTVIDHCLMCGLRSLSWVCDKYMTCQKNQVCFLQQLETSVISHLNYFHGGCTDEAHCDVVNVESFSDEHHLGLVKQGACCYHTACNDLTMLNHSNNGVIKASTMSPGGHCMHCVKEGLGWDCAHTEQCRLDEVCFVQKVQLMGTNPSVPDTYYHAGCISTPECRYVGTTSVEDEHGLATVVEGECCLPNNCNRHIMNQYKAHTTTENTTTRTPTTTPQPTTTTAQPTTTTTQPTTTTTRATTRPPPVSYCMECKNQGADWNCSFMTKCRPYEVCFIQEMKFTVSIPSLPSTYYHGGCISQSECSKISHTSTENEHGLATVVQGQCCSSFDCNRQIMKKYKAHTTTEKATTKVLTTTPEPTTITTQPTTTTTQPTTTTTQATTRPPPVSYCMECRNQGVNWNCSSMTKCRPYEICFVQEMKFTVSIPSLPITYYHGGCISQSECSKISHTNVENEPGLATIVQGQCCSSFHCNRQIMKKYKARAMCEVCQGPNCGPGSGTLSLCSVDSPLCMATVVNDQHGHKEYTKRCASETECKQKWLNESLLKSECVGFKKDSSYSFDFNCHYCCKTNGCNKDIVPSTDTMYTGKH